MSPDGATFRLQAFTWRKLTAFGKVEYLVNDEGQIEIRTPFPVDHHFVWDGGALRTVGAPTTMRRLVSAFGPLAARAEATWGIDRRIILTTIACESGPDTSEPSGRSLQSPRTEIGYPQRQGEDDHGDEVRDALDWTNSGGMHSSHGVMQTLIGTAVRSAPDLFKGVSIGRYREVLWDPAHSIECGTRYMRSFPPADIADPVRLRFHYGAGGVYPDGRNRWGGRMYMYPSGVPAEGPVILNFVAFFNDCVSVLGTTATSPVP